MSILFFVGGLIIGFFIAILSRMVGEDIEESIKPPDDVGKAQFIESDELREVFKKAKGFDEIF